MKRKLQEQTDSKGVEIRVIYDPFKSPESKKSRILQKNPKNPEEIICAGRLAKEKGQEILIRAVKELEQTHWHIRCRILGAPGPGDESHAANLKQLVSALGLNELITFEGFIDDVLPLYRTATAVVCPSYAESLGRTALEAWVAGALPIGWQGSGGLAEIVSDSGGGILYEKQAGSDLAAALRHVIGLSHDERRRMIDEGRTWMEQHCDAEKCATAMSIIWSRCTE